MGWGEEEMREGRLGERKMRMEKRCSGYNSRHREKDARGEMIDRYDYFNFQFEAFCSQTMHNTNIVDWEAHDHI